MASATTTISALCLQREIIQLSKDTPFPPVIRPPPAGSMVAKLGARRAEWPQVTHSLTHSLTYSLNRIENESDHELLGT